MKVLHSLPGTMALCEMIETYLYVQYLQNAYKDLWPVLYNGVVFIAVPLEGPAKILQMMLSPEQAQYFLHEENIWKYL